MHKKLSIIWNEKNVSGFIELINAGKIVSLKGGRINGNSFELKGDEVRLDVEIDDAKLSEGSKATIVTVRTDNPFSFFLRDVRSDMPIYIPEYKVIVTDGCDMRTFPQITDAIHSCKIPLKLSRIESEPEENFDSAAANNKNMPCYVWLGLSRDIRMFEIRTHSITHLSSLWDTIAPMYHHTPVKIPETGDQPLRYDYFAGRGIGCSTEVTRRLEQGTLPILNVTNIDDEVHYKQKLFVTNEIAPLTAESIRGTHYLVSDKYAAFPTPRTPEQKAMTDEIHDREIFRDDETVIYLRIEAINTSKAMKYAFVRIPQPNVSLIPEMDPQIVSIDENGFNSFRDSGRVFMIATVNGKPATDIEYSVLLGPGEKAVFEFKIPHMPISKERAIALSKTNFDEKLDECINFWNKKLENFVKLDIPEKRIEEMMKAGYLHLDLVCFGNEPDGPVAPVVGVYTPIGTESTPIIQYIESLGETKLAERAIMYFIEKQRPDGFMQNFQSYMSETGLGLWNAAEHFKYTRDIEWLKSIKDNLIRGCNYIIEWTNKSRDEKFRKKGYGMIYGKVADNEYPFHSYMLNSTTYGGLKSCAEVLKYVDEAEAERIGNFVKQYKEDILDSLKESFATSPVVPLSDGTWCPSYSPWPETIGMLCLFANRRNCYSHGSMVQISENGHYDIMYGIIEPDSVYANFITKMTTELLYLKNTAFSQPYYSVHPFTHLLRGEVKAFLKEFYNNVSALADREIYSFWEHLYLVSPHKTHEEGWFLMRCRWMLYMDYFGKLSILPGIPRAWLKDGCVVSFENAASRFGRLSVNVKSNISQGIISASIKLVDSFGRIPDEITVRIPHPHGQRAISVSKGVYCEEFESIIISDFTGEVDIVVKF